MAFTKERFESGTKDHQLDIRRDDGVYRHLSFGKPGTGMMRVDIVTWPGYLAYAGDMGAFVFSRVEDMFTFFRGCRVDPSYWAEKVKAADRDQVREWSRDKFISRAREDLDLLIEEDDDGRWVGVEDKFNEDVLRGISEKSKEGAYGDIIMFEYKGRYPFQEFYEVNTDIFTFRFLWCCHAIVRIIELYDKESR